MTTQKIIESKYFHCEKCGQPALRIIFAPGCYTNIDLNEVANKAKPSYSSEEFQVWVIGDSYAPEDPDGPHPSWMLRPFRKLGLPEQIRPSKFNKKIRKAQEKHCL